MALNWVDREPFAQDPWFLFGSQDSFSLFSPLYGTLIRAVGLSDAARLLVVLGGASWLGASWYAAQRVFSHPFPRGVVFLCCAVSSPNISPLGQTFVLNENFATARLLAVPLGIVGVVLCSHGRLVLPMALAAAATALHPLYGVWALLLVVIRRMPDHVLGSMVLIGVVILGLSGSVLPSFPLAMISPEWLAFLRASTKDLLVPTGDLFSLNALFFWSGALLLGSQYGNTEFRRIYMLVVLLAAAGYLMAAIVSAYWPVDLLLQVQPWRAVWLAAFFATLALVDVGWRLIRECALGPYYVILIAFSLVLCKPIAGFVLLVAWAIGRPTAIGRAIARLPSPTLATARIIAGLVVLAALPGLLADLRLEGETLSLFGWSGLDALRGVVGGGGYGLGPVMITAMLLALLRFPGVTPALLLPAGIWVALHWDTRGAWDRRWEESLRFPVPPLFEGFRRGQTIHWPAALPRVWFELGASGYVGVYHQSGLVFSRRRTELVASRWRRVAIASQAKSVPRNDLEAERVLEDFRRGHPERDFRQARIGNYVVDSITSAGVNFLCIDDALDWVVHDVPEVAGVAGVGFVLASEPKTLHYAHSCALLREKSGHQWNSTES